MQEQDVLDVLAKLADAGPTAWVDGGWGVDALLGVTTREHEDLDLVVRLDEIDSVRHVLARADFHHRAARLVAERARASR